MSKLYDALLDAYSTHPTPPDVVAFTHPIVVTQQRPQDWIAFLANDPGKRSLGRTEAEAIGKLHLTYHPALSRIQREDAGDSLAGQYLQLRAFLQSLKNSGLAHHDIANHGYNYALALQVVDLDNLTTIGRMDQAAQWIDRASEELHLVRHPGALAPLDEQTL